MKKNLMLVLLIIFSVSVYSQTKLLTIEETILGRRKLSPEDMWDLKWRDNSNISYIVNYSEIYQYDMIGKGKRSLVNLSELNLALTKSGLPQMQNIYGHNWYSRDILLFENENCYFAYHVENKKVEFSFKLDENAKNLRFCNANDELAFTIENNLYLAEKDGKIQQITKDEDKGIVYGDSYVHRQEFGIDNGIFWSPNGHLVAFYRKDETMVANYPIVDITTRIANLNNIKYPMAGETSEQVTLGIYDLAAKKTIFLKTGEPRDHYLARITWDPSEKYIYVAELNREQNHMKLNKYDVVSGDFISTLFEEKNSKYVEPEHDMHFLKTKPDQFVWESERDGYNHLYLYNTSGKMLKQITSGPYVVTEFLGFDKSEQNLFALTTMESPVERHLYKYNLKNNKFQKLTSQNGMHEVELDQEGKYFIAKYSSTLIPRSVEIVDNNGKLVNELLKSNNPLKDYKLGETNIGTIKAADGKTDLYYRMIKPVDFDPSKKYPVILYVYGGPHAQLVENNWLGGANLWDNYMAGKGYIMFTLDNRGSADRGLEFESIIHRQLGVEEMKDQMKGVEYLQSLPYVDMEKIGVYGWSYGGFMAISLMQNHPETFKAGVAGGPVIDWKYYEVMYGERYMDTPQENPEGYSKSGLLDKTKNLKGRLLVIHGTSDPVVVWQNSQTFVKSCVDNGVLIDYFIYPGHEHNVLGKDRLHLMKKISQYFEDFLK